MLEIIKTDRVAGDSCPSCSSYDKRKIKHIGFLVERSGKFGKFLGCSRYPDCKYLCSSRLKNQQKDTPKKSPSTVSFVARNLNRMTRKQKRLLARTNASKKQEELLKNFEGDYYQEKKIGDVWLVKQWNGNTKRWQVGRYSEESFKRYKWLGDKKKEESDHLKSAFEKFMEE